MPIIGVETYQNKHFIVIWCPGGETRPYSSPKTMDKDNKERIHYIRKSSNSVEPTDEDRSYFITRLFIHEEFAKEINERKMSDKMGDKMSDKMTEKEKMFFEILIKCLSIEEYVTTSSMSKITNMPISTVRRYLMKFCELRILYSVGKNKGTKYYLSNYSIYV